MLLQTFQNKCSNEVKKGRFTKATWQSIKVINGDEYKKVSQGVVRFVAYGHIKGVSVVGKVNTNEQCVIPNILYFNTNTNNYLVQMAKTKNKAHCKYYINGNEVDKATFEQGNHQRKVSQPSPIFRIKLENLLALGN